MGMATSAWRPWAWTACFISVGVLGTTVSCYTLETTAATRFSGSANADFGHGVVQHRDRNSNTWLVVSSPLAEQRQGRLDKCQVYPPSSKASCTLMYTQAEGGVSNSVLGLTLTKEESPQGKVMACAPLGNLDCGKNMFLKSSCYIFNEDLEMAVAITPGYQECPLSPIDMVILIDGSGSVSAVDFERTKNFIKEIFRTFKKKSNVQIAVVQFSSAVKLEINFATYQTASNLGDRVSNIQQMRQNTATGKAVIFITDGIFVRNGGARKGAQKVLVVVTDGESNDRKLPQAVLRTQEQNVVTYAIGVGAAVRAGTTGYGELQLLATDPDNDHLFSVTDYNALDSVLKSLEDKIFGIEGASGDLSTFEMELAGTGLSAVMDKDSITFGAVGAHGWMGGVVRRFHDGTTITSSNSSRDWQGSPKSDIERDSYLGYSLVRVTLGSVSLLASGAPHSRHIGTVYLFEIVRANPALTIYQEIPGHQLGSYFGAVLCAVDLNGDGKTNLLLISAPFFHLHGEEGRVYVYRRDATGQFSLYQELAGRDGESRARFGSAVASMGDVTGDEWPDVAIGAPGEEEGAGAVYVFHGERDGLSQSYSQRISGKSQGAGVKLFGRSLNSLMDISGDDLRDLAVGALGDALVLRSRPIVNVSVSVTPSPVRIPLHETRCPDSSHASPRSSALSLRLCFSAYGHLEQKGVPRMTINYEVALDVLKRVPRATFSPEAGGGPTWQSSVAVEGSTGPKCVDIDVLVACEIEDLFSPIAIGVGVRITSTDASRPVPILNRLLPSNTTTELHFQKNCGNDDVCICDLQVELTLDSEGPLVMGELETLTARVTLHNRGEEAYGARVFISVPTNLQYRSTNPTSVVRNLECAVKNSVLECYIDKPVLKASAEVQLEMVFDVAYNDSTSTALTLGVTASSTNEAEATLKDNKAEVHRDVRYSVNVVLKGADSVHLNYNNSETEDKPVSLSFTAHNLGSIATTVGLEIRVPVSSEAVAFLSIDKIATQPIGGVCKILDNSTRDETAKPASENGDTPVWDCHTKLCSRVRCSDLYVGSGETRDVTLALSISVKSLIRDDLPKRVILSDARLLVDQDRFHLSSNVTFHVSQARIVIESHEVPNHLPIIIGSTIGGLILLALVAAGLYKAGFFKRNYQAMLQDAKEETDGPQQQQPDPAQEPSSDL